MGTEIVATSIVNKGIYSSIDFVCQAGTECVDKAGISIHEVDILINIGVYHDDNIMEPAMAPLIQKKLGLNPDPVMVKTGVTFCFDLYNGACGFINALQVADSFLKTGQAKHVLIVSGDTHPSQQKHATFPFTPVGAAVLLRYDKNAKKGFSHFYLETRANEKQGLVSGGDLFNFGKTGRSLMDFTIDDDYVEELGQFISSTSTEYIQASKIDLNTIRFLISSQQKQGFSRFIHQAIGMNGTSRCVDLYDTFGDVHTSSLPLGYHQLREEGAINDNDRILFAAAGSGLTAAYALYDA